MMKNGKLFGKFNIIDLLIILIVIAALVFVGSRYLRRDTGAPANATPDKVRLTFFADDGPLVLKAQGDDRQLGRPVSDYDNSNYLGTLTSFEVEDAYVYEWDAETGEAVKVPKPLTCWVTFSCEGEGFISDDGLRINGTQYSIGGSYVIRAGQTRIYCRLADFERIG